MQSVEKSYYFGEARRVLLRRAAAEKSEGLWILPLHSELLAALERPVQVARQIAHHLVGAVQSPPMQPDEVEDPFLRASGSFLKFEHCQMSLKDVFGIALEEWLRAAGVAVDVSCTGR